jgi:hypothetical protein
MRSSVDPEVETNVNFSLKCAGASTVSLTINSSADSHGHRPPSGHGTREQPRLPIVENASFIDMTVPYAAGGLYCKRGPTTVLTGR